MDDEMFEQRRRLVFDLDLVFVPSPTRLTSAKNRQRALLSTWIISITN